MSVNKRVAFHLNAALFKWCERSATQLMGSLLLDYF